MSSILFGDTMEPIMESEYILLLGYSILCKENNLTGLNHPKTLLKWILPNKPLSYQWCNVLIFRGLRYRGSLVLVDVAIDSGFPA